MSGVFDKDMGYKALKAAFADLENADVYVGIRQEKGDQIHDEESGMTIASIAAAHEFGSEDGKHPPERSFLRSTMDENIDRYQSALADATLKVIEGAKPDKALAIVGAMAARDVKMGIRRGTHTEWESLSDDYLKRKTTSKYTGKRKGKGTKSTILIDQGIMVGAIDSIVVINGKESAPGKVE